MTYKDFDFKEDIKISPSNIFAFLKAFKFLFLSVISMFLAIKLSPYLIFISIIFAITMWLKFLSIISIVYSISPETIIVRKGIISRQFNSLELYRIKDYMTNQTLFMRFFNLMTVKLVTHDTTDPILLLEGIPFSDIDHVIRKLVQECRVNNRIFETI